MPKRISSGKQWRYPPPSTLHFELWVANRKDRAKMRRSLRNVYRIARKITHDGGGFGPWVFLADPDQKKTSTVRMRRLLGLKLEEDLWVELTFYPNKTRMRSIIHDIWKHPQIEKVMSPLGPLLSKRKPGYEATLAYLMLQTS